MFRREGKEGRWGRENTILCMYSSLEYAYVRVWGMYVFTVR